MENLIWCHKNAMWMPREGKRPNLVLFVDFKFNENLKLRERVTED